MKNLIVFISLIVIHISVFSQEINNNCDFDTTNCKVIPFYKTESNYKYHYKKNYMFITNSVDYELIRKNENDTIDFNKYNLFVGYYTVSGCKPSQSDCSLLLDTNKNEIKLIINVFQYGTCKGIQLSVQSFLVRKSDCPNLNSVCYTKKIIQNEN